VNFYVALKFFQKNFYFSVVTFFFVLTVHTVPTFSSLGFIFVLWSLLEFLAPISRKGDIFLCPLQCCNVVREETMKGGQKRIISGVAGRKEEKLLYFVTGFVLISSLLQE